MYLDANRVGQNAKARLVSPTYQATSTRCLQFWYNMYGADMGTLRVYTQVANSLGSPIWALSSDQGQGWQLAEATLQAGAQPYNVSCSFLAVFLSIRKEKSLKNVATLLYLWGTPLFSKRRLLLCDWSCLPCRCKQGNMAANLCVKKIGSFLHSF
jgi:hypothetical protein